MEIMNLMEVKNFTGWSSSTIYRHSKAGIFPKSRQKIRGGKNYWLKSEVEAAMLQQVA